MKVRYFSYIVLVFTLLYTCVIPVMASEGGAILTPVESDKSGSITIQLEDTRRNLPKDGVTLGIVQVADVIAGEFVLKEEYKKSNIDLNRICTAGEQESAVEELERFINTPDSSLVTDHMGIAEIKNLSIGVYLIYAIDTGGYDRIATSMVSIPTYNAENGSMIYDMELYPKHNPVKTLLKSPETGDFSKVLQYSIVGCLSLVLIIGVLWLYKRYRKSAY